jgi:ankyrin repeat protein
MKRSIFSLLLLFGVVFSVICQTSDEVFLILNERDLLKIEQMFDKNIELVNIQKPNGITPIIQACFNGDINLAKLILKFKPNLHWKTKAGWFPLNAAIYSGNIELVKLLLNYPETLEDINIIGHNGWTPISMAAAAGQIDMVIEIMKMKPKYKSEIGWEDLFMMSAYSNSISMLKYAMMYYLEDEVKKHDITGNTAIHFASMGYWFDNRMKDCDPIAIIDILSKAGVDVHFKNMNGDDALAISMRYKRDELIEVLK